MSGTVQKVVVIQDASRDICMGGINWALQGLSLKPGDELTLLAVLHQANTPSTFFNLMGAGKPLINKSKSDSKLGASQKIISEDGARKEKEYGSNLEILQIRNEFQMNKIVFQIMVVTASSPKVVAVNTAQELQATWIILDRQMKKEKKYFMEKLACGISRMKRNNNVQLLRGPKVTETSSRQTSQIQTIHVKHDEQSAGSEMKEGILEKKAEPPEDDELFSLDFSPYCKETADQQFEKTERIIEQANLTVGVAEVQQQDIFENYMHSHRGNGRPKYGLREFTYAELQEATNSFSKENFLSGGGFGSVYKGKLLNGQQIAVKQHNNASMQGEKEFMSEVHILSIARHENVVMLVGLCKEGGHRLLVYEFVSNGSLDMHLSKDSLGWKKRLVIARGIARGLHYLHQNNIIHRDLRPSNILLTHDYKPLLGDFGVAKRDHNEGAPPSEDKVVGTIGYLAPEYAETGKYSTKTDVYSYGVVLLDLITGGKNSQGKSTVAWAKPLLKEKDYPKLIDERILDSYDVHQLFGMVVLAEKCLSNNPDKRPSMKKVEKALDCIMDNKTVIDLEDFSPARSSVSSNSVSTDSQSEKEPIPHRTNPTKTQTQIGEAYSKALSMQSFSISSFLSASNSASTLSGSRKGTKGTKQKPRTQPVLYDEMLS